MNDNHSNGIYFEQNQTFDGGRNSSIIHMPKNIGRVPYSEWTSYSAYSGEMAGVKPDRPERFPYILDLMDMETGDFYRLEDECTFRFRESGPFYHLCTKEDNSILFRNDEEFKAAMNEIALVSVLFPEIKVLTFEIMNNHFHFAIRGDCERIEVWFRNLVSLLKVHPALRESQASICSLQPKLIPVENLDNMRNVIAYINRNGYVVNYDYSPFSYPWGANRYFFNNEAKLRFDAMKIKPAIRCKRQLFHSHMADTFSEIYLLDGYVSPLCFCDIGAAEGFFRNAQHYFTKISRSVESSSSIAKEIGECLYYVDDELYSIISSKCARQFGCKSPALIPSDAKISMAKTMHFEYNASNKQISRILRMDISAVRRLFPEI